MLDTIRASIALYGFEPVETPAMEYTDALGKFLPDQDRPNEGVFSFQDDDEQWMSLRYDLTAPLARYVAENFAESARCPIAAIARAMSIATRSPAPAASASSCSSMPTRSARVALAADAEICMLAADTMEALGIPRGQYVVKVNNRKILDGVREELGIASDGQWLTVMRAIDKLDRLGIPGVTQLLGEGRKDESGDFTKGAGLNVDGIKTVLSVVEQGGASAQSEIGKQGLDELAQISKLVAAAGYGEDRIKIDPSVVRGLEYYTGPVYEVELLLDTKDEKGRPVRFGSVGGGGRYDGLVSRFRGEPVPATGFSIGVSRLQAALTLIGKLATKPVPGPVVVTVFGGEIAHYQKFVAAAASGRHSRGVVSRQSQTLARPADEICRPSRVALRHHSGHQ